MKISTAFPSKYLRAGDLQGREVKVVIDSVQMEDVSGDGTEEKPVAYFVGKQKGLVLNKTNAGKLAAGFGDDTDEWLGKEILIYPDTTQFQGRMVDCLRVRVVLAHADGDDTKAPF